MVRAMGHTYPLRRVGTANALRAATLVEIGVVARKHKPSCGLINRVFSTAKFEIRGGKQARYVCIVHEDVVPQAICFVDKYHTEAGVLCNSIF